MHVAFTHTHTHTHTHACTHARTHARTHVRTHARSHTRLIIPTHPHMNSPNYHTNNQLHIHFSPPPPPHPQCIHTHTHTHTHRLTGHTQWRLWHTHWRRHTCQPQHGHVSHECARVVRANDTDTDVLRAPVGTHWLKHIHVRACAHTHTHTHNKGRERQIINSVAGEGVKTCSGPSGRARSFVTTDASDKTCRSDKTCGQCIKFDTKRAVVTKRVATGLLLRMTTDALAAMDSRLDFMFSCRPADRKRSRDIVRRSLKIMLSHRL